MPAANTAATTPFFSFGPCPETCAFCCAEGHRLYLCASANKYIQSRCASWINDRLHLLNGQPVPFNSTRCGLKVSIDAWLTAQSTTTLTLVQTQVISMCNPPPHLNSCNASARIEEVIESHILQVREAAAPDEEEFLEDIFEVFATERKRCPDKAPELSAVPPTIPPPALASAPTQAPATTPTHSWSNM